MKNHLIFTIITVTLSLFTFTACATRQSTVAAYGNANQIYMSEAADSRIPYVGSAHETRAVVGSLALPGANWMVGSIQIGQDHGDFSESFSPYTLTVFYKPQQGNVIEGTREELSIPAVAFEENANLLFELIGNLQAVTFSVRFKPR